MDTLDKYRTAWKNEPSFEEHLLSDAEIRAYLTKRSGNIDRMYRRGIVFDLALKGLLVIAIAGILLLYQASPESGMVSLVLGSVLLYGFFYERKIYLQMMQIVHPASSIKDALKERISFFNNSYLKALLAMATSNPVLILTGGMYYFYLKYGEIRPLDLEDILVFSMITLIGYFVPLVFQVRNFRFHVGQLETTLTEMDNKSISVEMVKIQHHKRKRIVLMMSLALLTGILLFFFILQ